MSSTRISPGGEPSPVAQRERAAQVVQSGRLPEAVLPGGGPRSFEDVEHRQAGLDGQRVGEKRRLVVAPLAQARLVDGHGNERQRPADPLQSLQGGRCGPCERNRYAATAAVLEALQGASQRSAVREGRDRQLERVADQRAGVRRREPVIRAWTPARNPVRHSSQTRWPKRPHPAQAGGRSRSSRRMRAAWPDGLYRRVTCRLRRTAVRRGRTAVERSGRGPEGYSIRP